MITINVTDKGVSGFNADILDELELGHKEVHRVSDINWSASKQEWEVRVILSERRTCLSDGECYMHRHLSPVLFTHKLRKKCIEWEHKNETLIREMRSDQSG